MEKTIISSVLGLIAKLFSSGKKSTYHQSTGLNFGSINNQSITQTINHNDYHHYQDNRIIRTPMDEELIFKMFNRIVTAINYDAIRKTDYRRKVFARPCSFLALIILASFLITSQIVSAQYTYIPLLIVFAELIIGSIILQLTGHLLRPEVLRFFDVIVEEVRPRQETTKTSHEEKTVTNFEVIFLLPTGKRLILPENLNYKIKEGDYGIVVVSENNKIVDFKRYFNGQLI